MYKDILLVASLAYLTCSTTLIRRSIVVDNQANRNLNQGGVDSLQLQLDWVCSADFEKVESAVYDHKRDCIYVSNGKKYGLGKDGFISKVSSKGQLLELKWLSSLNRPTGMAVHEDRLYIVDVDALVIVDPATATIVKRIPVPITYGLNDVTLSEDGTVYVTASAIHAVLKLEEETLKIWKQDEKLLMWANGIQASSDGVWVGGEYLVKVEFEGEITERMVSEPKVRDFEGIAQIGANRFLASTVENSALYLIDQEKAQLLLKPDGYFGDLEVTLPAKKMILVQGNHQEESYSLHCYYLR